jgi:hypothetical protein
MDGFVTGFYMRFCGFGLRLCHGYVGLGRVARRKALLYTTFCLTDNSRCPDQIQLDSIVTWKP